MVYLLLVELCVYHSQTVYCRDNEIDRKCSGDVFRGFTGEGKVKGKGKGVTVQAMNTYSCTDMSFGVL